MAGKGGGDGGLKVGDLYVRVGASIGQMVKDLTAAIEAVEEAADEIEGLMSKAAAALGDVSDGFLTMAASAGAAFVLASQHSAALQGEMKRLESAFAVLSREVGSIFLPLARELTEWLRRAIATWRNLDDSVKDAIVSGARWAAILGVGGTALVRSTLFAKGFVESLVVLARVGGPLTGLVASGLGKVADAGWKTLTSFSALAKANVGNPFRALADGAQGLVASLGKLPQATGSIQGSLAKLLPQIVALGAPVLALAAAVAGVVLLGGTLYKAWNDNAMGIQDAVAGVVASVMGLGSKVAEFFTGLYETVKNFALEAGAAVLEFLLARVRSVASFLALVARKLGREELAQNLEAVQRLTGEQLVAQLQESTAAVLDKANAKAKEIGATLASAGKDLREGAQYGLEYSLSGAKQAAKDIAKATGLDGVADKLKAFMADMSGMVPKVGDPGSVDLPDLDMELRAPGKVEWDGVQRAASYAKRGGEAMVAYVDTMKEKTRQAAQAMVEAMASAQQAIAERFVSATGRIAELANAFTQGMTAGGGNPLAGVGLVVAELLMQSEQFQRLVTILNNLLQAVADTLGRLLTPLEGLLGAAAMLVQNALLPLGPVFDLVGAVLEPLIPPLVMLGELLAALSPVIETVFKVVALAFKPTLVMLEGSMRFLFEVLKQVALILMGFLKMVAPLWNGLVDAVVFVLRAIQSVTETIGITFNKFIREVEGLKLDSASLDKSMKDLKNTTWESSKEKAKETAAVLANRQATEKATESLTNVPSSWKVALARAEAQDARTPRYMPQTGTAPAETGTPTGEQTGPTQGPAVVVGDVTINARDPGEAMTRLERTLEEIRFRNTGSRAGGGRYVTYTP
jgi:phage-related protein